MNLKYYKPPRWVQWILRLFKNEDVRIILTGLCFGAVAICIIVLPVSYHNSRYRTEIILYNDQGEIVRQWEDGEVYTSKSGLITIRAEEGKYVITNGMVKTREIEK